MTNNRYQTGKWLVWLTLFISTAGYSQVGLSTDENPHLQFRNPDLQLQKGRLLPPGFYCNTIPSPPQQRKLPALRSFFKNNHHQPLIYSYEDLALFCKLEVKMERAVRFPVKVRLGDVHYVDWLEGKAKGGEAIRWLAH